MISLQPLAGLRHDRETDKAVQAFNDYARMGPGRSLAKLHQKYTEDSPGINPPTTSLRWLKEWSRRFNWQERSSEYDAEWDKRKDVERKAEIDHGLALDYKRIKELKKLAIFLSDQLYEQGAGGRFHNLWLPDIKVVGHGEYAETVEIERFNAAIVREYRAVLDDIAKEMGHRVQRQEITGADGEALLVRYVNDWREHETTND